MSLKQELERNLILQEDLNLGVGEVEQTRAGKTVTGRKINAADFPYDENQTLKEKLDDTVETIENTAYRWRGNFDIATTYYKNDMFAYDGNSFIVIVDSVIGELPADNDFYDLISAQANGETTSTGIVLITTFNKSDLDGQNKFTFTHNKGFQKLPSAIINEAGEEVYPEAIEYFDNYITIDMTLIEPFMFGQWTAVFGGGVAAQEVQDAVQAAAEAQTSAQAAALSETNAAADAASASQDADEAEAARDEVVNILDGISDIKAWNPSTTYSKGDWARLETQAYVMVYISKVDGNLNNQPPLDPNDDGDSNWGLVTYNFKGNENFIADVDEARFLADGIQTKFNLTQFNASITPKSEKDILGVFVNNLPVSRDKWSITVNVSDESEIDFVSTDVVPAPEDQDATYSIIVLTASPKNVVVDDPVPVGVIASYVVEQLPQGWLVCDGSTINSTTYPDLTEYLNPGQSTAVLPDLRGVALRGWDNGRGLDAGRVLNTYQEDEFKSHTHTDTVYGNLDQGNNPRQAGTNGNSQQMTTDATGGDETRMKNHSVVYAIKAFGAVVNAGGIDLNGLEQDVLQNTNDITSLKNNQVLHVVDKRAANIAGGTCVGGWQERVLNTEVKNTITGASLSANRITLPAGTYRVSVKAPAFLCNRHKAIFEDVNNASSFLNGSTEYSASTTTTPSQIFAEITTTGGVFRVRHYTQSANAGDGLGVASQSGYEEIYTDVFIQKVGD